jgi:hypothetical protein
MAGVSLTLTRTVVTTRASGSRAYKAASVLDALF